MSKNNTIALLLALMAMLATRPANIEGANILGVFTSHSPSHLIVHMSVMKTLAEQGHNITVVATTEPKVTHKSIKQIIIPLSSEDEQAVNAGIKNMAHNKPSFFATIRNMFGSLILLIDRQVDALEDKRFTQLYENKDNKFDLVIVGFFFNTYQVGLGSKFNCPIIMDWSGPPMEMIDTIIGNPRLVSSVPNMNVPVLAGKPMDFKQRFVNFMSTSAMRFLSYALDFRFKGFYKRLFDDDKNLLSYAEAKKNVSLIFCNSHGISEGPIRPNVPGVIEIGGIQIKEKADPLPEDIGNFLATAKHGAILFSLGSNLKGEHIKPSTITKIYKTLSSLKQNVIWKWEDLKHTPGKAPNILYKKWLPQDDILAHPNLKLFITHAGKGGVAESQYHGVPMLALPVFADQPGNADKIVESGYGLRVDLLTLEVDEFKAAITELVSNPSYASNLKKFSSLYRDRPLSARESVIYWTDYVLRHKGAVHMKSPLVHLSWIASGNWDVYAFLIALLYVVILVTKIVLKFLYKKLCGKSNKTNPKKKLKKQ